jgi:ankyrin repeat protein
VPDKSNIWRDSCDGYLDWVKEHVADGCPLDASDACGDPPLVLACGNGHLAVARLLLAEGASFDGARSVMGETALVRAAHNGHVDVVRFLLGQGADALAAVSWFSLRSERAFGDRALFSRRRREALFRSRARPLTRFRRLTQKKHNMPPAQDLGGNTALHWAAMRGHVEVCAALLQQQQQQAPAPVPGAAVAAAPAASASALKAARNAQGQAPADLAQPQWSL